MSFLGDETYVDAAVKAYWAKHDQLTGTDPKKLKQYSSVVQEERKKLEPMIKAAVGAASLHILTWCVAELRKG